MSSETFVVIIFIIFLAGMVIQYLIDHKKKEKIYPYPDDDFTNGEYSSSCGTLEEFSEDEYPPCSSTSIRCETIVSELSKTEDIIKGPKPLYMVCKDDTNTIIFESEDDYWVATYWDNFKFCTLTSKFTIESLQMLENCEWFYDVQDLYEYLRKISKLEQWLLTRLEERK